MKFLHWKTLREPQGQVRLISSAFSKASQVSRLKPMPMRIVQRKMRAALKSSDSRVTDAIYEAGYNSSSRFYEASDKILGMKPKAFKSGGENETIRFAIGQSTLGAVLVAESGKGVCAILMGDDPQELIIDLEKRFPKAQLVGADRDFEDHIAQVIGFVENPRHRIRPAA